MSCLRSVTLCALFLVFTNSIAYAEPTIAALQPSLIKIRQDQLPLTIILGDIRGKLEATPLDEAHTEGASAFAQFTFSSEDGSKKGRSAELLVEAENGEIIAILGEGVKSDEQNGKRLVNITGIRAKHERRVLVEMKLRGEDSEGISTLKFAMRAQDEKEPKEKDQTIIRQTVALSWPVASCGRNYHSALKKIGETGGNSLRDVWRDARRPPKSMSRRWHFRPSIPKRSRRRQRGEGDGAISRKRKRAILTKAGSIMRSGFRRDLGSRGRYGWEISKTAADLKTYFSQGFNPSICTGALAFADYHEEKLSPLGDTSVRLQELASDAEILAKASVVKFIENMRNLPGGHPAWGGAGLKVLQKPVSSSGDDMKSLILRLLESTNAKPDAIADTAKAENTYQVLKILDRIGLKEAGVSSRRLRADLRQVLGQIEAAVRLKTYRAQYDAFWLNFSNSLKNIRAAHKEHCVCGS